MNSFRKEVFIDGIKYIPEVVNLNTNDTGKDKMAIKFIETDSKFLEVNASKYEDWYYMPFWFQKIKHGIYKTYSINELPERLKEDLLAMRGEQPTNDNAFVWTDELVVEFANYYKSKQGVDFTTWGKCLMDTFKQSEQSKLSALLLDNKMDKDWEIVSLHHKNDSINKLILSDKKDCYYWSGGELNKNPLSIDYVLSKQDFIIHSVRRLSDNCVFSVGSQYFINGYMNTIHKFEIEFGDKMTVYFKGLNIQYEISGLPPTPTVTDKPITKTMSNIDAYQLGLKDGIKFQQQKNQQQCS